MKFLYLALLSAFIFPLTAEAAKKKSKKQTPAMVQSVSGESSNTISLVTLTLDKKISKKDHVKLSDHGRYIQIDLSDTTAANPGSFYESNSPYLKKMALFETGKDTTALRIFTNEEAAVIAEVAEIDVLENRVILSLDHRVLSTKLKTEIDQNTAQSFTEQLEMLSNGEDAAAPKTATENTVEAVVASKADDKKIDSALDAQAPVTGEPSDFKKSLTDMGVGKTSLDLSKNLQKVSYFLGGLFVLLILALTLKRMKKNIFIAKHGAEETLKSLGTLSLNPKQQLNLIEVGGEKILLSVSNDTVSMLSHIGPKNTDQALLSSMTDPASAHKKLLASPQQTTQRPTAEGNFPEALKAIRKKAQEIENRQTISRGPKSRFTEAMKEGETFKPTRKETGPASNSATTQPTGKKINVAIGDDGVVKAPKVTAADGNEEAIKDVTSLIRRKLKDLPKF